MTYEQHKEMSSLLIKELEPILGREYMNQIIFNIAPNLALVAMNQDILIDDITVATEGPYHPSKVLVIQLIKHEAWCHYYSMVDEIAC